ncbi:MAG TPA: recombinase family protein [Polyangiaceae bacterium LLY-WYZ-15_(1-7)]|nr:resolvase [Sandaracinus sp.]HJL07738.1 recombinase family protein [Polyangiaceae bacterium LLY-WYZ-15_(1-7)]MBJ74655.1 resolvase [Sandaracinus sp.]HJL25324.1 recombinase family protein [Polyangiaceae bacterium LLY-WYZ-15_(1-7)]HJL30099.1 recombinase family protein [Polyangiaceae bacterium LLY-WYZ-15_(1-7)]
MNEPPNNRAPKVRCAIYTRKSTSEGLDSDFNTLDAQREAAEYFIRAMAGEGWEALPHRYDDGGFTGANTDRPALKRLLADIEAGAVDCVVVYKVDRLSRSLMDFAKLLALFDQKDVTFVSTTQNFNTTNSMGRLTLNILLSFAQFEREMIAERTRDKMAAARKRGKWLGSRPPYGYLGDHDKRQLVVCEEEAERVRTMFRMYLRLGSVNAVAKRINDLGWMKKGYRAKTGRVTPPRKYRDKDVHTILRNVSYLGKVEFNGELYEGEHEAIVSEELFARVQSVLTSKACGRGRRRGRNPEYLLQGIAWCGLCEKRITTTAGRGRNKELYRYYVCSNRGRKGRDGCTHPRLGAEELEQLVVSRVKARCTDPLLLEEIVARMEVGRVEAMAAITSERERIVADEAKLHAEGRKLMDAIGQDTGTEGKLLAERIGEIEAQLDVLSTERCSLDAQLRGLQNATEQVRATVDILEVFDAVWDEFEAAEKQDLVHLVVKRVVVNEPEGKLDLEFHDLAAPFEPLATEPEDEPDDEEPPEDDASAVATSAPVSAQEMEASP